MLNEIEFLKSLLAIWLSENLQSQNSNYVNKK